MLNAFYGGVARFARARYCAAPFGSTSERFWWHIWRTFG